MKKLLVLLLIGSIYTSCTQTNESFFETKDAYFGLKPPGLIPEVFAPSIINHMAHSSPTFAPDGKVLASAGVGGAVSAPARQAVGSARIPLGRGAVGRRELQLAEQEMCVYLALNENDAASLLLEKYQL